MACFHRFTSAGILGSNQPSPFLYFGFSAFTSMSVFPSFRGKFSKGGAISLICCSVFQNYVSRQVFQKRPGCCPNNLSSLRLGVLQKAGFNLFCQEANHEGCNTFSILLLFPLGTAASVFKVHFWCTKWELELPVRCSGQYVQQLTPCISQWSVDIMNGIKNPQNHKQFSDFPVAFDSNQFFCIFWLFAWKWSLMFL